MKRLYFGFSFGSAVSGAGSYSHRSPNISCGIELVVAAGRAIALGVVMSVALRGLCEVVRRLVGAGLFFFDLPEKVVQQRARAEAIARRVEPRVAESFLDCDEVMKGLLRGSDSASRLHADGNSRRQIEIANRLYHHLSVGERRTSGCFAGARLDEVTLSNHLHREKRRRSDVVVGVELTHLEDDFELRIAARFDDRADLVLNRVELSGEKKSAIDDHVDFVRAIGNRGSYFLQPQGKRALSRGERRRD